MVERTPTDAKNLARAGNLRRAYGRAILDGTPIRDQLADGLLDADIACFLGAIRPNG